MDKIALKMISEMLDSLEIKSAILLITVGTILTILALNQIVFRLRYRLPPGPLSLPFVGHLPFLGADRHLYFDALRKKYGNVFSLYLGTRFTVVVCDFQSIKDIAHKDTFTGRPPNIFEFNKKNPHFGEMSGSDWKEQRRFMIFSLKELGMGKTSGENAITNQVFNFLNTLSEESDGRDINIRDALIPVTNNIIFSMIADKQFNLEDKMSEIVKGFQSESMEFLELRTKQFYYPFLRQILGISNRKIKQGVEVISKFENQLEKEIDLHEQSYEQGCKRDFIDYYLEEIKKKELKTFTRETLIGNSSILMLIGAEAIKGTLEMCFMKMATFPDAQEKAHKEIINVVGTHRLPSWSDRNDLPYTMALLTEISRFNDFFTVNDPRWTTADDKIGEYDIPKGTTVLMFFWSVHFSKEIWGDPENFRPERFLTADGRKLNNKTEYVLLFSIGKRSCPGEVLGKVNVFLYFTAVLQRFRITPPKGGLDKTVKKSIVSTFQNPVLTFEKR